MIILAIETATDACSVALWQDGTCAQQLFKIAPKQHAEIILDLMRQLLSETGLSLQQVSAIAFGCGPGSFMGIRMAAAVAQGLAYGVDCPLIPVPTLQALAQLGADTTKQTHVLAAWDARMGGIYWGAYQMDQDSLVRNKLADQLSDPVSMQKIILTIINGKNQWVGVGSAWKAHESAWSLDLKKSLTIMDTDVYPEARTVAKIAATQYQQGITIPPEQARPIYLRNQVVHRHSHPR